MSKSLLQTVNQTVQTVPVSETPVTLSLGTAVHGYGCGIKLSGNAIRLNDAGYYKIDANVSVTPTAAGVATVALYDGNEQIEGAIAYASVSTADNSTTVPLACTIRRGCNCESADSITVRVTSGVAVSVPNVAVTVERL